MPEFMPTKTSAKSALLLAASLLILSSNSAYALAGRGEHVSFGDDITISEGEVSHDIVCAFCSVHIHGDVQGDVAVAFGSVTLDTGHSISGDLAVLGGDVAMADDTHIGGDVAIAAGDLTVAPTATIRGDRAVFPGRFWLLIPLLPFIVLGCIIWLIVYLIRRNRYQFPAYPNGRRV